MSNEEAPSSRMYLIGFASSHVPLFQPIWRPVRRNICFTSKSRRTSLTTTSIRASRVDDLSVEARTIAWAQTVVVGLGLCPFAKGALDRARVRVSITRARDEQELRARLDYEMALLCSCTRNEVETTLVVAPDFAENDFLRFHIFGENLEHDIDQRADLVDRVMLARFHPRHVWGDAADEDDPVNYDKRAPYPIVNLLRADQVDEYIDRGETEGILERNQKTLEKLGPEKLKTLYKEFNNST